VASPSTAYNYFLSAATTAAQSLAIERVPFRVENAADIERAIGYLCIYAERRFDMRHPMSIASSEVRAKPADLPVEAPIKYETILNLKTAQALVFRR
jgi:hypothetical protein